MPNKTPNISKKMKKITFVIPALNEEKAISPVIKSIPIDKLKAMGYDTEIMVIDNGSTDRTNHLAKKNGANVIVQPVRGYGNAYKAGFANASGDIIVTGDADLTYPFEDAPGMIALMESRKLDFITTDRLTNLRPGVMSKTHQIGNFVLTLMTRILYRVNIKDSQSGMWIFKRSIWAKLKVVSSGMPFSQELKVEAYRKGFKCMEIPIDYRTRAGAVKLNTWKDGVGNSWQLIKKRFLG
jgi:glycosyltransferase involved in cell wall biosynthesis